MIVVKKWLLFIYRIKEDVPVSIIGELDYWKTILITKLIQNLNNEEATVKIINIHPRKIHNYLCNKIGEINNKT